MVDTNIVSPSRELDLVMPDGLPRPNLARTGPGLGKGRPGVPRRRIVLGMTERFWEQVQIAPNGCLLFTGRKDRGGYGLFRHRGRQGLVHRAIYSELVGAIPNGLTLDHLCRNPACLAVDHLEEVSLRENVQRARRAIVACRQDHPFTAANTRIVKAGTARRCKTCEAESNRRLRSKEKAS